MGRQDPSGESLLRALELFSGTGSVGHELAKRGYQVTSLDLNKKFSPDICCDILKWDATVFPPGHFELITASPPCTEYSIAKTVGVRKLWHADELVKRTLALIQYFRPPTWWIENPRTGLLKSRPFMNDIPFVDVDYCQFACWGIKKPTRFWVSPNLQQTPPLCAVQRHVTT